MFCLFHNNSVTSFPVCSSKKRGSLPPKPEPPPPDALSVASLEALEETSIDTLESSDQKIDIRNRLHNLAFIFSLPHLVMLSNLQKLIGKISVLPTLPNDQELFYWSLTFLTNNITFFRHSYRQKTINPPQ